MSYLYPFLAVAGAACYGAGVFVGAWAQKHKMQPRIDYLEDRNSTKNRVIEQMKVENTALEDKLGNREEMLKSAREDLSKLKVRQRQTLVTDAEYAVLLREHIDVLEELKNTRLERMPKRVDVELGFADPEVANESE